MSKKYKLLKTDLITVNGTKLYRVKYSKAFAKRLGIQELGGYIQSGDNLSQEGNAMVSGNAKVFGNAQVFGNALVSGNAMVFENASVSGNALVHGDARVYGNAQVSEGSYTSKVITLELPQYCITVLSTAKLQIGCQLKSVEGWLKVTKTKAIDLGLEEKNFELFRNAVEFCSKVRY